MDQTSYLAELVRINDTLIWSIDRADSYVEAVGIIRELMGARLAPSFMLDETGTRLVLVTDDEQRRILLAKGFDSLPAPRHLRPPWINEGEWPVSASDHLDHESWAILPDDFKEWFGDSGVVVPVHADGRHLGAVLLAFDGDFTLTAKKRAFLAAAGRVLGSAVYRWQMSGRERELSALQERSRLGDELHADLSQQVAALGLRIEATKLDVAKGSRAQLAQDVEQLGDLVGNLKKSLRHQMLGLRADAALVDGRLIDKVRERVDDFRTQVGIVGELECQDEAAVNEVPLPVAAQLIRVLQEALSNTYFHAHATKVTVRLLPARTRIRLEIEDNGHGFDLGSVPDTRLGLRIMRERMSQIDGVLTVVTLATGGTLVIAEAPLPGIGRSAAPPGAGTSARPGARRKVP